MQFVRLCSASESRRAMPKSGKCASPALWMPNPHAHTPINRWPNRKKESEAKKGSGGSDKYYLFKENGSRFSFRRTHSFGQLINLNLVFCGSGQTVVNQTHAACFLSSPTVKREPWNETSGRTESFFVGRNERIAFSFPSAIALIFSNCCFVYIIPSSMCVFVHVIMG